jgi:hypothetical protein
MINIFIKRKIIMQDRNLHGVSFKVLEERDIDGCAELIGKIFGNFSTFSNELELNPSDLKQGAKLGLSDIYEDQLTIIATDSQGKIIGCCAGIKLTKIRAFKNGGFKNRKNLTFDVNLQKMKVEEKNSILAELEFIFLMEPYQKLLLKNEAHLGVYGRYFCISDEYFGTSLAKYLAFKFFTNSVEKGMKHCFAIIFNRKVYKMMTKYFQGEILKEFKVVFVKENERVDIKSYLFYGSADKARLLMKARF